MSPILAFFLIMGGKYYFKSKMGVKTHTGLTDIDLIGQAFIDRVHREEERSIILQIFNLLEFNIWLNNEKTTIKIC